MSGSRHSRVVVIVGSQGARPAAREILDQLPECFPAALIYVQHRVPTAGSVLIDLLRRTCDLPVVETTDGSSLQPGVVHVPPPACQTVIDGDGRLRLDDRAPRCMGDPLLISAARAYGPDCTAVILSGRLDDGARGLQAVKAAGGCGLIQAPASAECGSMPRAAMATGCFDYVLDPVRIGRALVATISVSGAAELLAVRPHPLVGTAA
jgi:two-component system chemotaxis response regulator CheB